MTPNEREALLREVLEAAEIAVECHRSKCGETSSMNVLYQKARIARQALNGHDVPLGMTPNASGHIWPYILRAVGERLTWAAQDLRTGFRHEKERGADLHRRITEVAAEVSRILLDATTEKA